MTAAAFSSLSLCPINFREFNLLNAGVQNAEAVLLYSKFKFHLKSSLIQRHGKTWIARSRAQIATWFGFSPKKVDRLIAFLERKNLIEKRVGRWSGKKSLFITAIADAEAVKSALAVGQSSAEF